MIALIQRAARASVEINRLTKKSIGKGLVVFIAAGLDDTEQNAQWLSNKILNLRIFPDGSGRFDRSVLDVRGDILIVPQFTLYGDCMKGRRPDFTRAARPETAVPLYESFVSFVRASNLKVETGEFAADMLVSIDNDGPVTLLIDTESGKKT